MRYTWLGALVLGLLPAVASADHGHGGGGYRGGYHGGYHHEGYRHEGHSRFGFSFGLGIGPAYGYRDYCYGPDYYSSGYYAPAYCPPPVVVYEPPMTVYSPPPVYSAPPVYSEPPVYYRSYTVSPAPRKAPAGPYYYNQTRSYYGR
jgi:hypothetical protein